MLKSLMDDGIVELVGPQMASSGASRETVLVLDEELEEEAAPEGPEENAGDEPGPGEGEDSPASRERPPLTKTPAVPPPKPQEPAKKGHSGIVRIGKRRRPTPPS
jgi:hypothetical protein